MGCGKAITPHRAAWRPLVDGIIIETAREPQADLSIAYQRVSDGSARYETFAFRIESAPVTAGMRSPIKGIGCKLRSGRSDLEGISNKTDLQLARLKGRNRSLDRKSTRLNSSH